MQYALHVSDAPDDADGVVRLFSAERGCAMFEQRVLRFDEPSTERTNADDDEVLYVLGGSGSATFDAEHRTLAPGTAAFVARGTPWRVVVELAAEQTRGATSGRQFRLLATPAGGCASVTQFVGYIPVGRAPDHFHKYDEVVYVLEGEGSLHIGGESAPLRSGSSVHLPARLVHCLQNDGPGVMQVLGVFRPAGSPAEAYYPDGTPAAMPADS